MTEEWRPVVGYEGLYEVSSHGRVRSLRLRHRFTDKLRETPIIMRQNTTHRGYAVVTLGKNNVRVGINVHSLVLTAFCGPRPLNMECGHLDGRRDNNHKDNLRWITHAENEEHKVLHGTVRRGSACRIAKLTEADVKSIRATYVPRSRDHNSHALAKRYGVAPATIQWIVSGRSWNHVR